MAETDDLIRRVRDGDHQALETLVARFDRYVFDVALLVLGDRVEAQDAAQEALIKAVRNLKSYNGRATFRTWLYRITVNTCRDTLRRRTRQREVALEAASLTSAGPLQAELARERQQAVWQAGRAGRRPGSRNRHESDLAGAGKRAYRLSRRNHHARPDSHGRARRLEWRLALGVEHRTMGSMVGQGALLRNGDLV